jgi:hypothetical protein
MSGGQDVPAMQRVWESAPVRPGQRCRTDRAGQALRIGGIAHVLRIGFTGRTGWSASGVDIVEAPKLAAVPIPTAFSSRSIQKDTCGTQNQGSIG